jgi:hypothetical protein
MKIRLAATLIAALLVPAFVIVSGAGADNPHGVPPGQGGDPNASCGGTSGGKPPNCNSPNLPFSEGCQHGQAPVQNPHCEPSNGTPPGTTTTPSGSSTPASPAPAAGAQAPQSGVAGAVEQGGAGANQGDAQNKLAAQAAREGAGGKLPFTGLETLWLALFGAAMLGTGLALRARSGSSA